MIIQKNTQQRISEWYTLLCYLRVECKAQRIFYSIIFFVYSHIFGIKSNKLSTNPDNNNKKELILAPFYYSLKASEYFIVPLIESSAPSYNVFIINSSSDISKGVLILYLLASTYPNLG